MILLLWSRLFTQTPYYLINPNEHRDVRGKKRWMNPHRSHHSKHQTTTSARPKSASQAGHTEEPEMIMYSQAQLRYIILRSFLSLCRPFLSPPPLEAQKKKTAHTKQIRSRRKQKRRALPFSVMTSKPPAITLQHPNNQRPTMPSLSY